MKDRLLLMSTRLKMPQPRKNYIAREELFSKLDRMNEYSVILIKGGAGTGKTTLIASFAREKALCDMKWISLDESCNNAFLFWSYFIEAAGEYLEEDKQEFLSLYDANFQKSNLEQLVTILINKLNTEKDIYIALDDFYHITDDFLISTIDFFIKNMPDNVHLILLTRQEPLLYLSSLNMEGRLLVIDENDLKLPTQAGIRFLTDTLKLSLDSDTLKLMNNISEGWIGGLQLIAAAGAFRTQDEIKRLNLESKLVGDYLTKEIYDILDDEEKNFLVMTSILTYFSEEIYQRLLGKTDFKRIMDGLTRKNILIICVDEIKGVYRYHNILREYLKIRFKEFNREKQIELHLKAADILREMGDANQCIDQLLLAEDYLSAMNYVLELPKNMALFSYVDKIPAAYIIKNPDFAYQSFFYHYSNMEFEKCRELYESLKDKTDEDPAFLAFRYSNILVEDSFDLNQVDIMPASEIDKLPLKESTKALIFIRDATFLYTQQRYDEALSFLDKAVSYSGSNGNFYIVFFSFSIKSQILEDMGELSKCQALYKEMGKMLESYKYVTMLNASFYIGYTGVLLKQMELESAKSCLRSAEGYVADMVSPSVIGYKYNLAEYKFIIGETEDALGLFKELINMKAFSNIVFMNSLLQYVFKLNNWSGELVQRFIEDYESVDERYRSLDSKLLYVHILLNKGKVIDGLELIDSILKYSRMHKIKIMLVKAALSKAGMVIDSPGKKRDIINLFKEALFYSCEDRILLPFYVESETVAKVVRQYDADIANDMNYTEKAHYKNIMELCRIEGKIEEKAVLSDREIDVLKEMTSGASNKEIADRLCISLATVKTHIINIYSKLQVNNRVGAIETAKNLRII